MRPPKCSPSWQSLQGAVEGSLLSWGHFEKICLAIMGEQVGRGLSGSTGTGGGWDDDPGETSWGLALASARGSGFWREGERPSDVQGEDQWNSEMDCA